MKKRYVKHVMNELANLMIHPLHDQICVRWMDGLDYEIKEDMLNILSKMIFVVDCYYEKTFLGQHLYIKIDKKEVGL